MELYEQMTASLTPKVASAKPPEIAKAPVDARPRMTLDAWCIPLGVNLAALNGKSPEQSRAIIREQIARMAADQAEAIGFPLSFERALAAIHGEAPGALPQSRLGMIASMLGATEAELATMSVDDAPKFIAHRISDLAMSQICSVGVPANSLPKVTGEIGGGDTLEEIRAEAAVEKDPAKLGALAAKAIAIRDRAWARQ